MSSVRRWSAVIASLLIAALGWLLLFGGSPLFGLPVLALGLGLAAWKGVRIWRSRPDPYDLSKLWEREPEGYDPEIDQPEEEGEESREHAFCHNCGHAVARPFARCPDCGNPLQ